MLDKVFNNCSVFLGEITVEVCFVQMLSNKEQSMSWLFSFGNKSKSSMSFCVGFFGSWQSIIVSPIENVCFAQFSNF